MEEKKTLIWTRRLECIDGLEGWYKKTNLNDYWIGYRGNRKHQGIIFENVTLNPPSKSRKRVRFSDQPEEEEEEKFEGVIRGPEPSRSLNIKRIKGWIKNEYVEIRAEGGIRLQATLPSQMIFISPEPFPEEELNRNEWMVIDSYH